MRSVLSESGRVAQTFVAYLAAIVAWMHGSSPCMTTPDPRGGPTRLARLEPGIQEARCGDEIGQTFVAYLAAKWPGCTGQARA
jgi:hypothetical protein